MDDSTNLGAPFFGPEHPIYPPLNRVCRISDAAVAGQVPRVYPGFVVQFVGNQPRDREACYITEPNNVLPGMVYAVCRLIGVFGVNNDGTNSKPLYATSCCPVASTSSSASGGGGQVVGPD